MRLADRIPVIITSLAAVADGEFAGLARGLRTNFELFVFTGLGIFGLIVIYKVMDDYTLLLMIFQNIGKSVRRHIDKESQGSFGPLLEIFLTIFAPVVVLLCIGIVLVFLITEFGFGPVNH